MASPALDFTGKWLTSGNPADASHVTGHVRQKYLQLSAADRRLALSVF